MQKVSLLAFYGREEDEMRLALLIAALLVVAGCRSAPEERLGAPEVYARIEQETDCKKLQAEFEIAYANWEREKAAGAERVAYKKVAASYMDALDNRMKAIGC